MRKLNNYIRNGLLIYAFSTVSKEFFQLPEFVNGFCVGLSIVLLLLGAYRENHNINKLKNFKRNIFMKLRNL
ncbi:hypothetical protein [uncultured Clostridium sp.]|jgi:hypothetical protein|uniref:hypothetical protein n=1 Tax=uncultured Clostridium sp. TaxID=59620 RepID=UPI0025ED7AF8|nr:hypothetical protein [uncultured Clostridium sp.]